MENDGRLILFMHDPRESGESKLTVAVTFSANEMALEPVPEKIVNERFMNAWRTWHQQHRLRKVNAVKP